MDDTNNVGVPEEAEVKPQAPAPEDVQTEGETPEAPAEEAAA